MATFETSSSSFLRTGKSAAVGRMSMFDLVEAGMASMRFTDDTQYEAGMCTNGGHYRQEFIVFKRGGVMVKYYFNSSEFHMCGMCGEYDGNFSHSCEWEIVSKEELERLYWQYCTDVSECCYYEGCKALTISLELSCSNEVYDVTCMYPFLQRGYSDILSELQEEYHKPIGPFSYRCLRDSVYEAAERDILEEKKERKLEGLRQAIKRHPSFRWDDIEEELHYLF